MATPAPHFPTDTDGTNRIWLAGGYDSTGAPVSSMEIFECTIVGGGLTLESSFSREGGRAGSFDVPLPGVEDRSDGNALSLASRSTTTVTGADSASTSCGS